MDEMNEKTRRMMRAEATRSATRIMRMTDSTQKRVAMREHSDRFDVPRRGCPVGHSVAR